MKTASYPSLTCSLIALGLLSSIASLSAVDGTYNQSADNGSWETSANWLDGIIADGEGAVAAFDISSSTARTISFSDDHTVGAISLRNAAGSYSLTGLNGASLYMNNGENQASITHRGSSGLVPTLLSDIYFYDPGLKISTATGASAFTVGSSAYTLRSRAEGDSVLHLENGGGGVLTVNSNISEGDGALKVRATAGNITLTGVNSFTGGLDVEGGAVTVNSGAATGLGKISLGVAGQTNTSSFTVAALTGAAVTIDNDFEILARTGGTASLRGGGLMTQTGDVTYKGNINLGAQLDVATNGHTIFEGSFSGTGELTLSGGVNNPNRAITLSGNNTHTGGTRLFTANTVYNIGSATALGTGRFSIGTPPPNANNVTNNLANLVIDNTTGSDLTLAGNTPVFLTGFTFRGTNSLNLGAGAVTIGSTVNIVNVEANVLTIDGVISQPVSGAARNFGNSGPGVLKLTNENTYRGRTAVGGILEVSHLANGGAASNIGQSSNAAANLTLNRGVLRYVGDGDDTDRLFTIGNGGGTIDSSGSGELNFTNTGAVAVQGDVMLSIVAGATTFAAGGDIVMVSGNLASSTADLAVGMTVTGTGIAPGTTIAAILDGGRFQLSAPATANAAVGTLSFGSLGHRDLTLTGSNGGNNRIDSTLVDGTGANTLGVKKEGEGKWVLTGVNTYTGATQVDEGILEIADDGENNSSSVKVAGGGTFLYNSTVARTGAIDLNGAAGVRARLSGEGDINTALTLNSIDDALAPGNGVGVLNFGVSQVWDSFTYELDFLDFDGTAGADFDQINITGSLALGGGDNAYVLDVFFGDGLLNFTETDRSWTILTATDGIASFDAAVWTLLMPGAPGDGHWSISQGGNALFLNYSTEAIPEPSTVALMISAVGLSMGIMRRRRRA